MENEILKAGQKAYEKDKHSVPFTTEHLEHIYLLGFCAGTINANDKKLEEIKKLETIISKHTA